MIRGEVPFGVQGWIGNLVCSENSIQLGYDAGTELLPADGYVAGLL